MNRSQMRHFAGEATTHDCAPKDWRDIPNVSGDYDLDATLMHRANPALPARLELYLKRGHGSYGPLTGYNGYHGYEGDN
jgi:hypothetical protein